MGSWKIICILVRRCFVSFAPRNPFALEADFKAEPPTFQISPTHYAATWLLDDRAPRVEMPSSLRNLIEAMTEGGGIHV